MRTVHCVLSTRSKRSYWLSAVLTAGFGSRCGTSIRQVHAMALSSSPLDTAAVPYEPPSWAKASFTNAPLHGRLKLGNFPTPLYRLDFSHPNSVTYEKDPLAILSQLVELHDVKFYIKRDDSTGGLELGGNKVRKLEFLLADALAKGANAVITIGGEQSNHCRATAAAARMVGLEPHLILRSRKAEQGDLGMVGNLLVNRLMQAKIYTCTPGEYGRIGSTALVRRLAYYLDNQQGKTTYSIPVGGSNGIGTWGYVEGVDELLKQWKASTDAASLDHIVMACGSGGTTAGIAVGVALAFAGQQSQLPTVHAVGVCDSPEYFYKYIEGILTQMGFVLPPEYASTQDFLQNHLVLHQGKGLGYAVNTPEELDFIQSFALATGVILDPVYSGKAMYNFVQYLKEKSSSFDGSNILFWHTGGGLGLYDKIPAMQEYLESSSPCQRLDVYGNKGGIDISKEDEQGS